MKLKSLQISGFGKLVDREFDFSSPLNLVVGPNEAGKTTLLNCILGVLYGFKKQKKLYERYIPWSGKNYHASLTLLDNDNQEYMINRDFTHDSLEIFRCEGQDIYRADQSVLQDKILREAGLVNPYIFESTLFVRQSELSNLSQDKLSEAINKKITTSEDDVSAREALRQIENKIKDYTRKGQVNPGILTEAERLVEELEKELAGLENHLVNYETKVEKKQETFHELEEKTRRLAVLEPMLEQFHQRQALLKDKQEIDRKLSEVVEKAEKIERLHAKKFSLEEELQALGNFKEFLGQGIEGTLEDINNYLQKITLEKTVHAKQKEFFETETDDLQAELQQNKEKLSNYDTEMYSPANATRVSYLQHFLREKQAMMAQKEKQREEVKQNLKKDRLLSAFIITVTLLSNVIFLGYYYLLTNETAFPFIYRMEWKIWWPCAAVISLCDLLIIFRAVQRGRRKSMYKRLGREIRSLIAEVEERQKELSEITRGQDPEIFMQEMEKIRLIQNDIWHLEHSLAQKGSYDNIEEKIASLDQEEEKIRQEQERILNEAGCVDHEEFLKKANRFKELWREKQTVEEKIELLMEGRDPEYWQQEKKNLAAESAKIDTVLEGINIELSAEEAYVLDQEYRQLHQEVAALRDADKEYNNDIKNYHELVLPKDSWEMAGELAEAKAWAQKCRFMTDALRLAQAILQEASDEVTNRVGPDLEENAAKLLCHMTNNKYKNIKISVNSDGLAFHVASPEKGRLVSPDDLSMGTKDQIYLSVRIALSLSILGGSDFPIFLDDPFVHFDEERLQRTIEMMYSLSKIFQVIWLTKDESIPERFPGSNVIRM